MSRPTSLSNRSHGANCLRLSFTYYTGHPSTCTSARRTQWYFQSYSVSLVAKAFTGAKASHFLHDMFCRRTPIAKANGDRESNDEIYGSQDFLRLHQAFTLSFD